MERNIKYILNGVAGLVLTAGLWGCASENPFDTESTGTVSLHAVVNTITTRADGDSDLSSTEKALRDNCVVYISNSKGLIYKKKGLDNVDETLTLKTGSYVAEAWSGDSVTASFDKMFFRGYEPFSVTKGSNTNVVLNCKIQNVVASINTSTIDPNVLQDDYQIIIKNSRGQLTFDKETASSMRGYFMMPDGDDTLEYEITGTSGDGKPFTKTGVVKQGVERAHHYILNFKYGGNNYYEDGNGAVFFQITIADENLNTTTSVAVPTAPSIAGEGFNIKKQQNFTNDADIPESGLMVKACAFGDGISELTVTSTSASELGLPSGIINVYQLDTNPKNQCLAAGLSWTEPTYKESTNVSTAFLSFSKEMLKRLSANDSEHVITIGAKDRNGYTSTVDLRIARSAEAIILEDPIVVDPVNTETDPMSVTGSSVTVSYSLSDEYEGTPGVEYRKAGSEEWTFQTADSPSKISRKNIQYAQAKKYSLTITGLEPGITYQYRACCGEFHGDIMSVTTEEKFIIPYADMETWNSFTIAETNDCTLPGTGSDEFWGNGNPGSMTLGVSLTQKSTDMFNSGKYSAKLRSQFVAMAGLGKFAAGNLFTGTYIETVGTDGHLKFGRPYNGSHPKALKVMVNYRPGVVSKTASEAPEIVKDGLDQAQIYWALTTEPFEILTKKSTRKLFDPNDPIVLAYGEYTFKESYGPDGQLKDLVIPIEYKDNAKTTKPAYLVIVCSASKFGDYFCGGEGSTMYVDDFELIY